MRTPPTRRQRTLTNLVGVVVIASVALGWLVGGAAANWLAGEGWTAPYPRIRLALFTAGAERPPLVTVLDGPANTTVWVICVFEPTLNPKKTKYSQKKVENDKQTKNPNH